MEKEKAGIQIEKISTETSVKELTLALMYLTRFNEKNRFYALENNAWKGYPFKVLDELDETGFINRGSITLNRYRFVMQE